MVFRSFTQLVHLQSRGFPWRHTANPYAIWISEIMLQQTQVRPIIPYYIRWMERFPDINAVAEANLDTILEHWEGLGYYSRARNFHKAARMVKERFQEKISTESNIFRTFPGVGEYTAAAVMYLAFGRPIPAVDGNIKRIGARYPGLRRLTPKNLKRINNFFAQAINPQRPGNFNQALMDLGSAVCKPKEPLCTICPLKSGCHAKAAGSPGAYPINPPKISIPHHQTVAGIIWNKEEFLVTKRVKSGLLGSLGEIPGGKVERDETNQESLCRELRTEWGLDISAGKWTGSAKHAYTRLGITVDLYQCTPINGSKVSSDQPYRWIKPRNISNLPFSKVNHKLFEILNRQGWCV